MSHLAAVAPRVKDKIVRDATMTTGAAWDSEDAGPNRIQRWVMQLPDDDLAKHGVNMASLRPHVVAKLRDKAASYEACMAVAQKLAALVYAMEGAPVAPAEIRDYFTALLVPPRGPRSV